MEIWLTSHLVEPSRFQDSQDVLDFQIESPAPSPTEDDEDNEVPPTQEDPITPDTKAAEVVPESPMGLPEENMDSVPGEAVEPEGDKGEVAETPPKEHHILDGLLTRVQQDMALGKVPGKGRRPKKDKKDVGAAPGRGRGRNKGEGKGRGRGAKAAKSKASKPRECRKLPLENVDPSEDFSLSKEPELWEDSDDEEKPISNPGGAASGSRPEADAKAKPSRPEEVPKRRGRKPRVESAGSAPKAAPKKRSAPKEKPGPKKSAKGGPTAMVGRERTRLKRMGTRVRVVCTRGLTSLCPRPLPLSHTGPGMPSPSKFQLVLRSLDGPRPGFNTYT